MALRDYASLVDGGGTDTDTTSGSNGSNSSSDSLFEDADLTTYYRALDDFDASSSSGGSDASSPESESGSGENSESGLTDSSSSAIGTGELELHQPSAELESSRFGDDTKIVTTALVRNPSREARMAGYDVLVNGKKVSTSERRVSADDTRELSNETLVRNVRRYVSGGGDATIELRLSSEWGDRQGETRTAGTVTVPMTDPDPIGNTIDWDGDGLRESPEETDLPSGDSSSSSSDSSPDDSSGSSSGSGSVGLDDPDGGVDDGVLDATEEVTTPAAGVGGLALVVIAIATAVALRGGP